MYSLTQANILSVHSFFRWRINGPVLCRTFWYPTPIIIPSLSSEDKYSFDFCGHHPMLGRILMIHFQFLVIKHYQNTALKNFVNIKTQLSGPQDWCILCVGLS